MRKALLSKKIASSSDDSIAAEKLKNFIFAVDKTLLIDYNSTVWNSRRIREYRNLVYLIAV